MTQSIFSLLAGSFYGLTIRVTNKDFKKAVILNLRFLRLKL